ncbi:unnamed protein product, partial [Symbiodinium necroappetens]
QEAVGGQQAGHDVSWWQGGQLLQGLPTWLKPHHRDPRWHHHLLDGCLHHGCEPEHSEHHGAEVR